MSATKLRSGGVSRRTALKTGLAGAAAAALGPVGFVRKGWAQSKTMSIGIWAGAQGEYVKNNVIAPFENEFDCKVLVNEGWTLAQIARVRAERDNPQHTVAFVDDLGVEILKREGLINPLPRDQVSNLERVYPRFIFEDGYGVAIGVSMAGIAYNPTLTKAPQSYREMWDEKYRRRITMYSMKSTSGVQMVVTAASLATGKPFGEAQYESGAAWPMLEKLKPNILNIARSNAQAVNQVIQGEALFELIDYSKWVYPYTIKGAPIDMAYPEEGTWAGINAQTLVKGGPHQELGAELINRMISPEVQMPLAKFALAAPPIRDLEFPADVLKYLAYPEKKMDQLKLFSPDWKHVNASRPAWTEKWNVIFTA